MDVVPYFRRWYDIKNGFIESGKAGENLGFYAVYQGQPVTSFFGRILRHAKVACWLMNRKNYKNLHVIAQCNHFLWITTPDGIIPTIEYELSKLNVKGKSICHISGSLSSTALHYFRKTGVAVHSIHSLYFFFLRTTTHKELQN